MACPNGTQANQICVWDGSQWVPTDVSTWLQSLGLCVYPAGGVLASDANGCPSAIAGPGTDGEVLVSNAASNLPSWTALADAITLLKNPAVLKQTLIDAAVIGWDMSLGPVAEVTLGGNRTMAAPTNIKEGATYILFVIQDAVGGRTLGWDAATFCWPLGNAPTLSTGANAIDVITFIARGGKLYGVAQNDFQ